PYRLVIVLWKNARVTPVGAERPRLDTVTPHGPEDLVHQAPFQRIVEDRVHDLDAATEVSRHPVGARAVDLFGSAVLETKDARVLEEAVDDGVDSDALAHACNARSEAADAAHQEIDLDARL